MYLGTKPPKVWRRWMSRRAPPQAATRAAKRGAVRAVATSPRAASAVYSQGWKYPSSQ